MVKIYVENDKSDPKFINIKIKNIEHSDSNGILMNLINNYPLDKIKSLKIDYNVNIECGWIRNLTNLETLEFSQYGEERDFNNFYTVYSKFTHHIGLPPNLKHLTLPYEHIGTMDKLPKSLISLNIGAGYVSNKNDHEKKFNSLNTKCISTNNIILFQKIAKELGMDISNLNEDFIKIFKISYQYGSLSEELRQEFIKEYLSKYDIITLQNILDQINSDFIYDENDENNNYLPNLKRLTTPFYHDKEFIIPHQIEYLNLRSSDQINSININNIIVLPNNNIKELALTKDLQPLSTQYFEKKMNDLLKKMPHLEVLHLNFKFDKNDLVSKMLSFYRKDDDKEYNISQYLDLHAQDMKNYLESKKDCRDSSKYREEYYEKVINPYFKDYKTTIKIFDSMFDKPRFIKVIHN